MSHCRSADLVEQPALGLGRRRLEGLVEGTAGRDDPQIAVQHHQRLADRGNDALGEVAGRPAIAAAASAILHCFSAVMSANVITTPSITLSAVR